MMRHAVQCIIYKLARFVLSQVENQFFQLKVRALLTSAHIKTDALHEIETEGLFVFLTRV